MKPPVLVLLTGPPLLVPDGSGDGKPYGDGAPDDNGVAREDRGPSLPADDSDSDDSCGWECDGWMGGGWIDSGMGASLPSCTTIRTHRTAA